MTPLMKQYSEIKSAHPDKILLYRMGDFYEMFFEDAVSAAPVLGIALTQRNKKSADETPMCGVPHHSIAGPINKLLAAGFKVAICDQIEDPKLAKGIVKRAVTRVLTPGVVYDPATLEGSIAHYLCAYSAVESSSRKNNSDLYHVAFLDCTTGEAFYYDCNQQKLLMLLQTMPIAEFIKSSDQVLPMGFFTQTVTVHDALFADDTNTLPEPARRLLDYALLYSQQDASLFREFEHKTMTQQMSLGPQVLRHLEIFATYRGDSQGSLYHSINRTKTSAGARLLRSWLSFPLYDFQKIGQRQDRVDLWKRDLGALKNLRSILAQVGDLERRFSKIVSPQCTGRDLQSLADSMESAAEAESAQCLKNKTVHNDRIAKALQLSQQIRQTIVEDPPVSTKQGYLIRKGVSPQLDELIDVATHANDLIAQMEARERQQTGISSLKIRYNNVFGYYIEITHTHKDKIPEHYRRKQTLTNAERYCTDELVELEKKILSAQSRRADVESEIFESLRTQLIKDSQMILSLAHASAEIDVISSLAWLSLEENYSRPQFDGSGELKLIGSRHPVIAQSLRTAFVANDIRIGKGSCLLLTGPNMAGKSTIMRQVALTAILAQIGSDVPAQNAVIPLYDAIFTRIGASDQLNEGLSTFMVEMTETAQLLKEATQESLLILDEVGRGTSTFDGMCLAQAILENILSELKAMTFFATHYHELTGLAESYSQIANAHMSIIDGPEGIRFTHTLMRGAATKSYGIHVAELAGLPSSVTKRARSLLRELEGKKTTRHSQLSLLDLQEAPANREFDDVKSQQLVKLKELGQQLRNYKVMEKSPIETLNQVALWQKSVHDIEI